MQLSLVEYLGKKTLIIASAIAIVISLSLMYTPVFAHYLHRDGTEVNSWDNTWNETHRQYLANESRNNEQAYSYSRPQSNTYIPSYTASESYRTNSYSDTSRVVYNRDGTEVNSWDNTWNETHRDYLAQEQRNKYVNSNNNNYNSNNSSYQNSRYSPSYTTYYRENQYNNRAAQDADFTQNARYAYDYDDFEYYTEYDFSNPYTLSYNDEYDDSFDDYSNEDYY